MAPDQIRGGRGDAPTDLYSLGILLYELATGEPPFRADHYLALMGQHVNAVPRGPRELRPDLPPQVEAIILEAHQGSGRTNATRPSPMQRPTSRTGEPSTSRPRYRTGPPARPRRRLRGAEVVGGMWKLVAVVASVFVLIVAIAVLVTIIVR
jgi:serine/threonine-protein kinase